VSKSTIETFFTGKTFVVPKYQRDYAWKERNVDDLFEDVAEALEDGSGHYLGTFILSQSDRSAPAQVVDGQQRLTTLTMLLHALIDELEDVNLKQYYYSTFIEHPAKGSKFRVLGDNDVFFRGLMGKLNPEPASDGQCRLLEAYQRICFRVKGLRVQGGQELLKRWLLCITEMEVLEFIEPNEGKAIRMFQSVNDRGVPLAKMDIVKSLLVYYSNRYLDAELDDTISERFGCAFKSFSRIKRLAREPGYQIRLIDRETFTEDDVLRYHYFAFDGVTFGTAKAGADYNATSETVLEVFLKPTLQVLRSEPARLREFIAAYVADLAAFFAGLEELVSETRNHRDTYLLFVVQDLAATLYPLAIRLHLKGWLSETGLTSDSRCLLEMLALADLRVFKLKGTNPQADIFWLTRELPKLKVDDVVTGLQQFCQRFMSDASLQLRLVEEDMYRNLGLTRMLLEEETLARAALSLPALDIAQLAEFNRINLTIEHILPQKPEFDVKAYGFGDGEAYEQQNHRIGNLVLLEKPLNSACNNRSVEDKMSDPDLYRSSKLKAVRALSAHHAGIGQGFNAQSIDVRSKALAALVAERWPIVAPQAEPGLDVCESSEPPTTGAEAAV